MNEITGYVLVNDEGEYVSMSGGATKNWFNASKFDVKGIDSRRMYLECGFKLKKFKVIEEDNIYV